MHIHQFWFGESIPFYVTLSLQSMLCHHTHVTLWCYFSQLKLPPGISVRSAELIMPQAQFESLFNRVTTSKRHQQIAMASDFFRFFLLAFVLQESEETVAYVDCDTLALRPLPEPDASGLVFSSVPAKQTGAFAPRHYQLADVGLPHHFSIGCLIVNRQGLPFIKAVVEEWHRLLNQKKMFRQYTALMVVANRIRQHLGYTNVYPPLAFCPLLPFAIPTLVQAGSDKGFTKYGTVCPSADMILQHSYVVHLFGSKQYLDQPTWVPTSMIAHILQSLC